MIYLTEEEVQRHLRRCIRTRFRTQGEAAKHFGVSTAFISAVINGKKPVPDYMLEFIRLKRKTIYHTI